MEKTTYNIEGMHCGSCALGIQMVVSGLDGVQSAQVSYDDKKGTFEYDPAKVKKEDIEKAMSDLGYKGTPA
jgi:copper chaperone CopZ